MASNVNWLTDEEEETKRREGEGRELGHTMAFDAWKVEGQKELEREEGGRVANGSHPHPGTGNERNGR